MSELTTQEVANKLVAYCKEDNTEACLNELYSPDAKSIEAMTMPGSDGPSSDGIEAIKAKHAWWYSAYEVHSSNLEGPFMHGDDRFAVIFDLDASDKESGERFQMKEVGIYTVNEGKIIKEEFYYNS